MIPQQYQILKNGLKSDRVRDWILESIKAGKLKPGQKLPSEREIAKQLNVTQQTVRRGLADLVIEGEIEKRPRVGNFVRKPNPKKAIALVLPDYMYNDASEAFSLGSLLGAAHSVFKQNEYSITPLSYRTNELWQSAGVVAETMNLSGLLISTRAGIHKDDIVRIIKSGIKVVLVGHHPCVASLPVLSVEVDYKMGLMRLYERLKKYNHKKILLIRYTHSPIKDMEDEWLDKTNKDYTGGPKIDVLEIPNFDGSGVFDFSGLSKPFEDEEHTAYIAHDDLIVSKILKICEDNNIRIPEDISLATLWDRFPYARQVPISAPESMALFREKVEIASEYLKKLIRGQEILEKEILLRCDIKWTNSIALAPARNGN